MKKLKKYIKRKLNQFVIKNNNFDPLNNIIIFSDPRGGSTWITEIIMQIPKSTVLWEPLHLTQVEEFNKLNFYWRQYIPEDVDWNEAQEVFENVLAGKVLNDWTCQLSSPFKMLSSDKMIVKFVRANAMIPWITNTFKFKYAPVHLIRHPFAVVASQLNYNAWDYPFEGFKVPDTPYNEIYADHKDFLSKIKTKEESLVAIWCITNMIPLKNNRNNSSWLTVFYEDLIIDPEKEINRIFNTWNIPVPSSVYGMMRKASSTTKDATFTESIESQLSKWKKVFNEEQLTNMQEVLDYFDVKIYTSNNVKPIK